MEPRKIRRLLLGLLTLTAAVALVAPAAVAQAAPAKPALAGICGEHWGTSWPPPQVVYGSVDTTDPSAVKLAQCYLNFSLSPVTHTPLAVDGHFGDKTLTAVREFQDPLCGNAPPVDGKVGPITWGRLRTVANSPYYAC
jgi:lysozyme